MEGLRPNIPAKIFSEIIEHAECTICNEIFDDDGHVPQMLHCMHYFCMQCINTLERSWRGEETIVECPVCKTESVVGDGGFRTVYGIIAWSASCKKVLDQGGRSSDAEVCDCGEQFTEDNMNFCESCYLAVCDRCAWKKHREHFQHCRPLATFIGEIRKKVQDADNMNYAKLAFLEEELAVANRQQDQIKNRLAATTAEVENYFSELIKHLTHRKTEMVNQIKNFEERQMKKVQELRAKLEEEVKQIQQQKVQADELISKTNVELGRLRLQVDELVGNQADTPGKEIQPLVPEYMHFQPSLTAAKAIDELNVGRLTLVREKVAAASAKPSASAGTGAARSVIASRWLETPLHYAAYDGDVVKIKQLLATGGAAVNEGNERGETPLMWAAYNRRAEAVNCLLINGANLSFVDCDGWDALHCAAQGGDPNTITTLISAGAHPNTQTNKGKTPSMIAARNGHADALDTLAAAEGGSYPSLMTMVGPLFTMQQHHFLYF